LEILADLMKIQAGRLTNEGLMMKHESRQKAWCSKGNFSYIIEIRKTVLTPMVVGSRVCQLGGHSRHVCTDILQLSRIQHLSCHCHCC
jgi:hypothetical protein